MRAQVAWRRSRCGAGRDASVGRSAAPLPCDACDPGLAHLATRISLRASRCARTDAPSQWLKRAARAARVTVLLGAPQARRVLPRTVFAAALVVFGAKQPKPRPRVGRHPAGAICAATRSAGPGEARTQCAPSHLTRGICLSAARQRVASCAALDRAEPHSAVGLQGRPPHHEPVAGAARCDALNEGRKTASREPQQSAASRILAAATREFSRPGIQERLLSARRPSGGPVGSG